MKNSLVILILCILTLTFAVQAQDTPKDANDKQKTDSNKKLTAQDYENMLAKLKEGDTTINFVDFRLAYTETEDYSPYDGGELRGKMMKAIRNKKYKDALKSSKKMLKTNYCDLHSHYTAYAAYKEMKKEKEATFHKTVLQGLMDAILVNDGLSTKTGIISIGISEQYFVMNLLGFQRKSKALTRENGSTFDVHTAYNKKTKETRKFYFNIDKVFGNMFK